METTTITINISTDVLQRLRKLALAQEQKKGFLGRTITAATREYLKEQEQDEIRKELLKD